MVSSRTIRNMGEASSLIKEIRIDMKDNSKIIKNMVKVYRLSVRDNMRALLPMVNLTGMANLYTQMEITTSATSKIIKNKATANFSSHQ